MNLRSPKNIDPHAAHLSHNETITGSWTFNSPILVPVGSYATPGLAFVGDPDTGISRDGPGSSLQIAHNGSPVAAFAIDGININAPVGNVNAGRPRLSNTPINATVPGFTIRGDENTGIGYPGADQINLITGGVGRLSIDSNGLVGIGTNNNSPSAQLDVEISVNTTIGQIIKGAESQSGDFFQVQSSDTTVLANIDNTGKGFFTGLDAKDNNITNVGDLAADTISSDNGSTLALFNNAIHIDSAKRVGINTTGHSGQVEIASGLASRPILRVTALTTQSQPYIKCADTLNVDYAQIDASGNIISYKGFLAGIDGMSAPGATVGLFKIYVDTSDGDLKVVFGDGTVKTIATDT